MSGIDSIWKASGAMPQESNQEPRNRLPVLSQKPKPGGSQNSNLKLGAYPAGAARSRPLRRVHKTHGTHGTHKTCEPRSATQPSRGFASPITCVKTRLTKTGWLFLWGAVLLYLASLTSQSSLLILLIGIFAGCVWINLAGARRIAREVRIEPPFSECIAEGERPIQSWRVTAPMKVAAGFVEVIRKGGVEPVLRIAHLAAGATTAQVPALSFQRRGVYPHDKLEASSTFPFGLVRCSVPLTLAGEVVVVPAVYAAETPPASGYEPMLGGKFKGQRRSESGAEFAGIRPFRPGDPVKQIHWKSSSKGTGLMVKTFNEELSGRIGFILDCDPSADPDVFDNTVRAAGSLMFAALDKGHHVELVTTNEPEMVAMIPPFADGEEMLRLLARLEPQPGSTTRDILEVAGSKLSRKCSVCLVLTRLVPETAEVLAGWTAKRRRVSVYAPLGTDMSGLPAEAKPAWFGKDTISRHP